MPSKSRNAIVPGQIRMYEPAKEYYLCLSSRDTIDGDSRILVLNGELAGEVHEVCAAFIKADRICVYEP